MSDMLHLPKLILKPCRQNNIFFIMDKKYLYLMCTIHSQTDMRKAINTNKETWFADIFLKILEISWKQAFYHHFA